MSVKFELYLSDNDFDRLFAVKNCMDGLHDLTGNEYAEKVLSDYLRKRCPRVPEFDECGNMVI